MAMFRLFVLCVLSLGIQCAKTKTTQRKYHIHHFDLADGETNIINVEVNTTKAVKFQYIADGDVSFITKFDGELKKSDNPFTYVFTPEIFEGIIGSHFLTFALTSENTLFKTMIAHYAVPITGLEVNINPIVELNEKVDMIITLESGSNVEIEIITSSMNCPLFYTKLTEHSHQVLQKLHFITKGIHNVLVFGSNGISKVFKKKSIYVIERTSMSTQIDVSTVSNDPPSTTDYVTSIMPKHMTSRDPNFVPKDISTSLMANSNSVLCFDGLSIFDRHFKEPSQPLKSYSSARTYIKSRLVMRSSCPCLETPTFNWNVTNHLNGKIQNLPTSAFQGDKILIDRHRLPAGLYRITLNVTLTCTFVNDIMFLRLMYKRPFAFIIGGSRRLVHVNQKLFLNAADNSHAFDETATISFYWICKTATTISSSHQYLYIEENVLKNASKECKLGHISPFEESGYRFLNVGLNDTLQTFIIQVYVCARGLRSLFQQTITVQDSSPTVEISCLKNCLGSTQYGIKISHRELLIFQISFGHSCCGDYTFGIKQFTNFGVNDVNSGLYHIRVKPGNDSAVASLDVTNLIQGIRYSLYMKQSHTNVLLGAVDFVINTPPYGGNCHVKPDEGYAMTQVFDVTCHGWRDEGDNYSKHITRNASLNVPLYYKYYYYVKDGDETDEKSSELLLYEGWEHSVSGLRLPLGDVSKHYKANVIIYISDRYGDSTRVSKTVKVKADDNMIPVDHNDIKAIRMLNDKFHSLYTSARIARDYSTVLRILQSTATYYNSDNLTMLNVRDDITETDIMSGKVRPQSYGERKESFPVANEIKNMTQRLSNVLLDTIESERTEHFNPTNADLHLIYKTMTSCVYNPMFINSETMQNVINGSDILVDYIMNSVGDENGPEIDEKIKSFTDGTLDVMDSITWRYFPKEIVNVSGDGSFINFLHDKNRKGYLDSSDVNDNLAGHQERVELLYRHTEHKIDRFKRASDIARVTVPRILSLLDRVQHLHISRLGIDESKHFTRNNIKILVERASIISLINEQRIVGESRIKFDNSSCSGIDNVDHVNISLLSFERSPFLYAKDVSSVQSKVLSVLLEDSVNCGHEIQIPNDNLRNNNQFHVHLKLDLLKDFQYFSHDVQNKDDSTIIEIDNIICMTKYCHIALYMRTKELPTEEKYDFMKTLSLHGQSKMTFVVPAEHSQAGKSFIGIKHLYNSQYNSRRMKRSSIKVGQPLNKNQTVNSTTYPHEINLTLTVATSACRAWNDKESSWDPHICKVLPVSTINYTVCRCTHSSKRIYATTYLPNSINFETVFSSFDADNASVYGTMIGMLCLYFIFVLWLRREDKKDIEKWAVNFLCDTDPEDTYFYQISVYTGLRRSAGTNSVVYLIASGEHADTGIRVLSDEMHTGFSTGSVKKFFMGTRVPLGELCYIRVWHDNSGIGASQSWYLTKITVDDLQESKRYVFKCDRWLAVEIDDGQIEITLPVYCDDDSCDFKSRFSEQTQANVTDNHLWMSVFLRPEHSNFTRVQRLTCILAMLFLSMVCNAMFFKEDNVTTNSGEIQIGCIHFTLQDLYISFIGMMITTPPILLVACIFRNIKTYPFKKINGARNNTTKQTDHVYRIYESEIRSWRSKLAVYFAWIIICLAVLVPAFFLILYSMEWGKSKSIEWLVQFVLSLAHSILIVDPIKVVAISTLFAVWFKSHRSGICPDVNIKKLQEVSNQFKECDTSALISFRTGVLSSSPRPHPEDLEKSRLRRKQEKHAEDVLIQLIVYGILVFVIYSISYINRDSRSFALKNNIDNYLVKTSNTSYGFAEVNNIKDFVKWFTGTFIPNYYPQHDCYGNRVETPFWFSDCANIRIGSARLRQVRMKKVTCKENTFFEGYPCVLGYKESTEEKRKYSPGWKPFDRRHCVHSHVDDVLNCNAWKYISSLKLKTIPIIGEYNTYSGGGYVKALPKTKKDVLLLFKTMMQQEWIDRGTRALFLEFTLYNPNVNLFTCVIFLVEFTEIGGAFHWTDVRVIRPYENIGDTGLYATLCYVIYIIALAYGTVKSIIKLYNLKLSFFQTTWNAIDFSSVILSYIALIVFIVRMVYAKRAMDTFYHQLETKLDFINFQDIVILDYVFNCIVGIILFISTLCILRILRYNKRLTQIIDVITNAREDITGFGFVFAIVFLVFVVCGYLFFGSNVAEYKSVFTTLGSLTNALIGKNRLDVIIGASPNIAQLYYIAYVFCVVLTLLTIFTVILNNSIREVRQKVHKEPATFGVLDVVMNSFRNILGVMVNNKRMQSSFGKESANLKKTRNKIDNISILTLVRDIFVQHSSNSTYECKMSGRMRERNESSVDCSILNSPKSIKNIKYASDPDSGVNENTDLEKYGSFELEEKIKCQNYGERNGQDLPVQLLSRGQTLQNIQVVFDEEVESGV